MRCIISIKEYFTIIHFSMYLVFSDVLCVHWDRFGRRIGSMDKCSGFR